MKYLFFSLATLSTYVLVYIFLLWDNHNPQHR